MKFRIPGYTYVAFCSAVLIFGAIVTRDVIPLWIGLGNALAAGGVTEVYARTMLKMDREHARRYGR